MLTQPSTKLQSIINMVLALSPQEQFQVIMALLQNLLSQQEQAETITTAQPLSSIIGTGQGSFASPEEADDFIRLERETWTS